MGEGEGRTRNMSSMSVPRPGPSSTIRKGFEVAEVHRPIIQSASTCQKVKEGEGEVGEERTSPKTWLISGLVRKSPFEPKTG